MEERMGLENLRVACIGLGRMGAGIARNVQAAGCRLTVYNRTPGKAQPFLAAGATEARTPREAAAAAEFVISSLMDDASVLDAMGGSDGILAGLRPGGVHIGTTTISPKGAARCAELHAAQGSEYLAAPVAGRPQMAAEGKLLTFVAGKPEVIERCRPLLEAYTARVIVVGKDAALANSMKLAGNFFIASLIELMAEVVVFAERRGLDPAAVGNMFKAMIPNPGFAEYVDRILTRDFGQAGFALDAGLKDIRLILEAAEEAHVPLPVASLLRERCIAAQALGYGQRDWSVFTEIERLSARQGQK
jgi:3-hydroxyisobutyrate dehydrogenase-like beta-hydroxyacid dehydrogenase